MSATKLEFDSDGSFINHVTYFVKEKELVVQMKEGRVYHHPGVSRDKFVAFMTAESHGTYYNEWIKGQHPYVASKEELKRNEDAFDVLTEIVIKAGKKAGLVSIRDELKKAAEIINRKV
jgi:hypothetical protein